MQRAPVPEDEAARLAELKRFEILDTLPEDRFDALAELAATLAGVPIALITFVDEDRQWNKACVGVDQEAADREVSFCGHAIANPDEPLVVEDAREDERFHDNPMVTGEPGFRFYAGVPIVVGGHALGTVCVLDREPSTLTGDQLAGLETVAEQVVNHLEDRLRERDLVERSRFMTGVIDSLHEQVAILDGEGTTVATNRAWDAFAEAHGASAGPGTDYQAASRPLNDEAAPEAHRGVQAVLDGERDVFELEYPCHGPDGKRWFRLTATGFEDAGRRYVVTAHRDVTPAKLAEEEREALIERLGERDQLLEHLGRALPQVLWVVDADVERFHFLGERAVGFWEMARETLEADPLAWLDRLVEDDRAAFQGWMEETLAAFRAGEREQATFAFRFQRPSEDALRRGRIEAFPIRHEGELALVAGVVEDRTAVHRESERGRQQAREQARLAELEQLVFATSHTLKTEVRRIRSFGQLLRSRAEAKAGDLDEPVEEMLRGSQRLEELHEALREYAEVTQGRVAPEPVDLEALAREVLAGRSGEIEAAGGSAEVGEMPTVRADPEQIHRVFAELVDNAIKFAGGQAPRIRVTGEATEEGVEVRVADEGVGFDPEYADTVFGIFQQLEPGTTEGVGVGLTIVQRIVENHGGEVRVETAPGEGATFAFTLLGGLDAEGAPG